MPLTRVSTACLCLSLLAWVTPAAAQFFDDAAGTASIQDFGPLPAGSDFSGAYLLDNDGGSYLLFEKMVGDGTGWSASYQRLGARIKFVDFGDSHLWGEGHAIITDESRLGFNLGGGYRWVIDGNVVGVHGWYDNFQSDLNNRFTQTTFGVELLHEDVDLRANAYIPFGEEEHFVRVSDFGTVPVFHDRTISFLGMIEEEQAMKGFDAEVGLPLFGVPWARAYAGGYYYESRDGDEATGPRGRIEAALSEDLSLNFMVTNDSVFDTNYNLGVEYRFSGGVPMPTFSPFHGWFRRYAQVRRQWPVATRTVDVPALIAAIDPRTGAPRKVIHVDNTNGRPGDGSFEDPFRSLPDSAPGASLILVHRGDGATLGNIALSPYQRLLGEGKPFTFLDPIRGEIGLPDAFAASGPAPILTPRTLARPLITIASGTEVNNFTIVADGTTAISGGTVDDFHIEMIVGRAENGIRIVDGGGRGIIRTNAWQVTDTGVYVGNTGGDPLYLDIEDLATAGGALGLKVAAIGGDIRTDIDRYSGNNHSHAGLMLSAQVASTLIGNVDDATVLSTLGTTETGFLLDVASGGAMAVSLTDVLAAGNGHLFLADVSEGQLSAHVSNGTFWDSGTGSGVQFLLQNATGTTVFDSLSSNRNAVDGLNAFATGAATDYSINVLNSELIANADDATDTTVLGGADLRLFVDPTLAVMSASGSGFEFDVRDPGSVLVADFVDTDLSQSGGHGVDGRVFNGGFASVDFLRSPVTDSVLNGFNLLVDRSATFVGSFDTSPLQRSGDNALDLTVTDGSVAVLSLSNSAADSNGENGLVFDVTGGIRGGSTLVVNVESGDFDDNPLANIIGSVDGTGSQAVLNINNTSASGGPGLATVGGLVVNATGGGLLNTNWTGGAISNINNDAVQIDVDGAGSQARVNFSGTTISQNAGHGIDGDVTGGGPGTLLDVSLSNSNVAMNAGNGVDLELDGDGALGQLSLVATTLRSNVGDGLEFDVTGGADLLATATGIGNFNSNFERAWHGTVDGAGSTAFLNFDATDAVASGREGGLFNVTGGGTLNLALSNLRVHNSGFDGLSVSVNDPDSRGTVQLSNVDLTSSGLNGLEVTGGGSAAAVRVVSSGANEFDDNNGAGIKVTATNVAEAVTQISAESIDRNGTDGVNIEYDNVVAGAIALTGAGTPATIVGNGDEGIEIRVTDSVLRDRLVGNTVIPGFLIDGFAINSNGGENLTLLFDNTDVLDGQVSNLSIIGGTHGILADLTGGGNVNLSIENNTISGASDVGIQVTADQGNHMLAITNNTVSSSGNRNIFVDLFGTATASLDITGNTVNGGSIATGSFTTGLTISGSTLNDSGFIPPDTMGGVGPNHVVEMINGRYVAYDKVNGTALQAMTLDQFWLNAGLPDVGTGTFDPRIIFDPTVGRWFAAAIDGGAGNNIYVAVSNSSDPTAGWQGLRFVGDSVNGVRFNDFDTFGVDGNGVYLATNNFGGPVGFDVSIYSIPKADLLQPVPTAANLTRFENLNAAVFGSSIQPVVDFGAPDGSASLLASLESSGNVLFRTDITGSGGPLAMLGTPVNIPVPPYTTPIGGTQPGAPDVEHDANRIWSNAVEVNGSIWAVHSTLGSTGNDAVQWFQIDESTNAVLQSGVIEDPNLDFLYPSIAVNPAEAVVIGFSGSGPSQFISTMAATGVTNSGGVTTFGTPQLLVAGTDSYFEDFGSGRNRWGDYSATVVDPVNPNTFWTFQERVVAPNTWGIEITQLNFQQSSSGGTTGDGISVQLRETAHLTTGNISQNISNSNAGYGVHVSLTDTATADDLNVDGNTTVSNGMGGVLVETASPNTLAALSVSGNTVTGNGGDGISVQLNDLDPSVLPDIDVDLNTVRMNTGRGINIEIADSSIDDLSARSNIIEDNTGGAGLRVSHTNTTAGMITADTINVGSNQITNNAGDGIELLLDNITSVGELLANFNTATTNTGNGLSLTADGSRIVSTEISGNTFSRNSADGVHVSALNGSTLDGTTLSNNIVSLNGLHGVELSVLDSWMPLTTVFNNQISGHVNGDGIRMLNVDTNAMPLQVDFIGNRILNNTGGRGINLSTSDADLTSNVRDNTVTGNGQQGINLDLAGTTTSTVDFLRNNFSNNGEEGVNIHVRENATLTNNDFSGNTVNNNAGVGLRVTGANDATIAMNLGVSGLVNGQNTFIGNQDAGVGIKLKDRALADISVKNTTIAGTLNGPDVEFDGDGFALHTSNDAVARTLTIGAPADTNRNMIISGNAGDGISIEVTDNSLAPNILIQNTDIASNGVHGIGIERRGFASISEDLNGNGVLDLGEDIDGDGDLGHAQIFNTTANSNAGNGLDLSTIGSQLPVQWLEVQKSTFNGNQIGMNFTANTDSIQLVQALNNTVSNNLADGINVVTNHSSAFGNVIPSMGDPTSPLAIRSVFSSNIVSGNAGNGFTLTANDSSIHAIDIDAAGMINAATGTSRTVIDSNAGNGIQITANGTSQQDVNIDGVDITNSANTTTSDGINIDANGTTTVGVDITDTTIGATIPHLSEPGLGGSGIVADVSDDAILTMNVGQNLGVDGFGNPIGDVRIYNNAGDGIRLTNSGPTGSNGSQVGYAGFERQHITANFQNVDSRLNGDQGLDIRLTGNIGGRAVQGDTDSPVDINVDQSIFSSNVNEGIFFQTNTGTIQNHEVQIVNGTMAGDNVLPPYDPTFNTFNGAGGGNDAGGFLNGFNQATLAGVFNNGRYSGLTHQWNNLYADMAVNFNVTNSVIQTNGLDGTIDDGFVVQISTNSYVASNISGNRFGGNGGDDFVTSSFVTTDGVGLPLQPNLSIDLAFPLLDSVFLDDTAQFDVAFQNNSGDRINVTALGAFYTNLDPGKQNTRGTSPTNRRADIFVLDDSTTVEANNAFSTFGIPQLEVNGPFGFGTNGYLLRLLSAHPNPLFPLGP
jgi:hypothetical protein